MTTARIYTVSREIVRDAGRLPGEPRWLLCNGERIAIVSSIGPAVIGEMTEEEAREQFPRSVLGGDIWAERTRQEEHGQKDGHLYDGRLRA